METVEKKQRVNLRLIKHLIGQQNDVQISDPGRRPDWLKPFQNRSIRLGLGLLTASIGLFVSVDWLNDVRENGANTAAFIFHYGAALFYSIYLLVVGQIKFRWLQPADGRPARWIGLVLWLISAFALNRNLAVFQQSTLWLQVTLVIACSAMVAYSWKNQMTVRRQQVLYVVLTVACWVFAYAAIYLADLYPISIPGVVVLGLTLHSFVPLWFVISLSKQLWQDYRAEEHLRPGIVIGFIAPLAVLIMYLISWQTKVSKLEKIQSQAVLRRTSDLPDWVLIAQQLKGDWLTNRLLQVGTRYDEGPFLNGSRWESLTATDDVKQHDPLVVIASRLFPPANLSHDERLNILRTINNDRHNTEEKFWLGRNLTTEEVTTQARIWPQFRLAYTEKTIRIRNSAQRTSREALYSFHLPEGSVVSALSLWINGQEERARLTTIAKADSAYRQIVNVESRPAERDPAVVYWREGNQVTVRVFPCPAGQDRQFRLGITSPLRFMDGQLTYTNIYFEGPDASNAHELVQVNFAQQPESVSSSWMFSSLENNQILHEGGYDPSWSIRFKAPALSTEPFQLAGKAYRIRPLQQQVDSFRPTDVYLDVNATWKNYQFTTAFWTAQRQQSKVWVFDDGLKEVTKANLGAVYEKLVQQQFSLFPIYRIAHPETALLITKGSKTGPTLENLRQSVFAERLQQSASLAIPIRAFWFDDAPSSPYLKTLAELRVLNLAKGTTCTLIHQLAKKNQFPRIADTPDQVAVPIAGVMIERQNSDTKPQGQQQAPDHLARLFAYNDIMQRVGRRYLNQAFRADTSLVATAQEAHILSPVSSLIVLETEHDYDRFRIKRDNKGLDNATLKEEGAVPEPHEWALLLAVLGFIGWVKVRWKKTSARVF